MQPEARMPALGILNMAGLEQTYRLTRHIPSAEAGFFIRHYWIVSWDLEDREPYPQHLIPNPCVNLVLEPGRSGIFGPATDKFTYLVKGKGRVFGVKFRPGGFYPFLQQPVSGLSGCPLRIADVLGGDDREWERAILSEPEEADMVRLAEERLLPLLPARDETVLLINRMMDRIQEDRTLTRVEELSRQFGLHIRKLQRLFHQYVGVSPKWVIKLYRLQNAAERLDGSETQLLRLAGELGYYDQSHFIREFKAIIGQTPEEYVRSSAGQYGPRAN
ncbi:AraC family transcriptional regulator [Paenibacillus sp. J31TS4]|uniref:helix-turn-helix domain-containing protein n=1 Tax=Paenibacillus sp. J31TS4 TaxID=2807195 RepID=UPI001B292CC0|nr:AraC family transcriptional regulator [Paenibacillus sp. J31TS4]GIP38901.1 AraC family transcriptional regulator [Paenibacillus sp. J31TS4]